MATLESVPNRGILPIIRKSALGIKPRTYSEYPYALTTELHRLLHFVLVGTIATHQAAVDLVFTYPFWVIYLTLANLSLFCLSASDSFCMNYRVSMVLSILLTMEARWLESSGL